MADTAKFNAARKALAERKTRMKIIRDATHWRGNYNLNNKPDAFAVNRDIKAEDREITANPFLYDPNNSRRRSNAFNPNYSSKWRTKPKGAV